MKPVRSLLVALLAVTVLGGATLASSAFAEQTPRILFLPGEEVPVEIKQSKPEPNTIKSKLENAAGKFSAEGFLLKLTATSVDRGKFTMLTLNTVKGSGFCTGEGESGAGEVLIDGTFLLRHDVTSTEGVGVLYTMLLILVLCNGTEKIHVLGNFLGLLTPVGVGGETTSPTGILHCSAATDPPAPAETKYWDENSVERSALLLANLGTGFKKACLDVGLAENVELTSSKMIELMD